MYGKMIKKETEYSDKMEVLEIASWHYHQTVGYEPIESMVIDLNIN